MQIIRTLSELDLLTAHWCANDEQFALVPTMGALHDGHLALIGEGKRIAPRVAATIFVNPLQFNDKADLARYPREEATDLAKLEDAGCDAVWLPTVEELYPQGFATTVGVQGISDLWEGEHRPGHFDGVATVVAKLLIGVLPNYAIFGEKDWQQLAVIRRLERDLGVGVTIIGYPTVRETDGLALSSRNALLSSDERDKAPALAQSLGEAATAIGSGGDIDTALSAAKRRIADAGFGPVDYVAYVDGDSLEPMSAYREGGRLIAAAFLGKVRLIDNMRVVSATG